MAKAKGFFAKSGPAMMVLVMLRDRPLYGYEIREELERLSDNHLALQFGTLYPMLRKLEGEGLVEGVWEHPEGERSRRIYQLTKQGIAEVERQLDAWSQFSNAVNLVIQRTQGENTT